MVLTDLPDRLKLLRKNVELNVGGAHIRCSARVTELVWGDDPEPELLQPPPEFGEDNNCDNVKFHSIPQIIDIHKMIIQDHWF